MSGATGKRGRDGSFIQQQPPLRAVKSEVTALRRGSVTAGGYGTALPSAGAGMGAGAGAVRTASATAAAVNGVKRADGARSGTPKPATVPSIADVGRAPHDAQDLKIEAAILKAFDVASSRPSDINQTIMAIMHCEHAATQRERRADAVKQRREPMQMCPHCGNKDQRGFFIDTSQGDVICRRCASVVQQHRVHDGEMYRKFEGEEDRSHHGRAPNRLFSGAFNLRTETGAAGSADGRDLRNTQERLELNLSNMGSDERKTRVGYKEQQKRQAFEHIDQVGSALSIGSQVRDRAKTLFAFYRDSKEQLHGLARVVACCLIGSYRDLRLKGKVLSQAEERRLLALRQRRNEKLAQRQGFPCQHCRKFFVSRDARDDHVCPALTPQQQAERRKQVERKREEEAKRLQAEKGKMMALPPVPKKKKARRRPRAKKKPKAAYVWEEA